MMMTKINMETNHTQVIKIREEKNKNTITRGDKVVEKNKNREIHKGTNDLTTSPAELKKIVTIERETKKGKENRKLREGQKEIKKK